MNPIRQTGFTLIEVVVVLIALGITAAMATPMITGLLKAPESARKIEAAFLAQQQCAERVLAARAATGFLGLDEVSAALPNPTYVCDTLPTVDNIRAKLTVKDNPSSVCPSSVFCKQITISAINTATNTPVQINPITLILAK